jgi:hypothetical protein
MSDKPIPTPPSTLSQEQVGAVSGGTDGCTPEQPEQYIQIIGQLTSAYEGLVDFTSHVIERIAQ